MNDEWNPLPGEVVERLGRADRWRARLDDGSVLVCCLPRSYVGCRVGDPEKQMPEPGDRVLVERSPSDSDLGPVVRDPQRGITVMRFR